MVKRILLITAFAVNWLAPDAWAQLHAEVFVSNLTLPVAFVQDPSDATVQYVVQQGGRIRVVKGGALQSTDFLNVTGQISNGGERGLLGLAFPPDYATSGRFYVYFTNTAGDIVVARFKRSTANPLVADPTGVGFRWPDGNRFITHQPFGNHNGGTLAFGPDGYLYIGTGDGGSGDDPTHNAQNPFSLLGKMLRLNVSVSDADPEGYDVPPDNPFVSGGPVAALHEIWAFGVRNPWKFSFDDPARGGTGALVIGDVGQGSWEEIDYQPAGRGGRNYGWRNREGAHSNVTNLPPAYLPLIDPIWEYDHSTGQSITGGFVYRGGQLGPNYRGRYFFADFVAGRVWSLALTFDSAGEASASGLIEHTSELAVSGPIGQISSFGLDATGELYVVSYSRGQVLRIGGVPGGSPSSEDLVVDFGTFGVWMLFDGNAGWAQLHTVSAKNIVTGDLDGNGIDEVIVDFGPSFGIWVWANNLGWYQLHASTANRMVTGDLDGNGHDELLVDFPGFGIWVWFNNTSWSQLHASGSTNMVTADLDGNGRKEAIIDFPGSGIWVWTNNTSWDQLHQLNSRLMTAGDFDGNGKADLIVDFAGHGLWTYSNNSSWSQVHPFSASHLATGDIDGNGQSDLIVDFGSSYGIWMLVNATTWSQLHTLTSTNILTAGVDGSGKAEVIANFGSAGLWEYANNANWVQLHGVSPGVIAVGHINAP